MRYEFKIPTSNEYKRQQLIKHQPFTADVDILASDLV